MNTEELFNLRGKVACVTGASSGIGKHTATLLANNGVKVVGVARNQDLLNDWAKETGGHSSFVSVDLSKRSLIKDTVEKVTAIYGPPDILINAAGINTREHADDVTFDNWDKTIEINLSVPFFLSQGFVPEMQKKNWGRIINIASLQSRRAFPSGISYGASKGGVEQLTRAMAEAWSSHGIMVNSLAPGFFPTELTKTVFSNPVLFDKHAKQTCVGKNGCLTDLDGPIIFLSSDASKYVTGQILFVDGGFTAK
ncbi:MAG: SDR family oxidoreductase [Paracoccaceae bacterium]|jgi:NAD(P)-dependent dehydrogenase (short-subunit alcohol dehydrogenase family)|nr:SDR family oxidoreductase [Paracoccaceae bacterium]